MTVASAIEGPVQFRSPTVDQTLVSCKRLPTKYRAQSEEEWTWDERSFFEVSEDASSGTAVPCHAWHPLLAGFADEQSFIILLACPRTQKLPWVVRLYD